MVNVVIIVANNQSINTLYDSLSTDVMSDRIGCRDTVIQMSILNAQVDSGKF